ncbi:MAG: Crp/Fnr family transcriptional regulator [Clostridia bacterium]|nr:Crp/Fnr family transcriptional regulator [Clostridia bacterium]
MAETTAYLEKLPFWAELTDEERRYAERNSAIRHAPKDTLLYSRDCACMGLVYVIKGSVRIYLLSPEGREITLFHVGAGEPCVLSASCVVRQIDFDTHMVTEEDSELVIMNAEAFGRLTDANIHARCFLFEHSTESFSAVMRTMEKLLFTRFDSRLASFLVSECERTGSCELNTTQGRIAEQVNSAREVVARMLKQFSDRGIVRIQRGRITVLDIEALRELAQ